MSEKHMKVGARVELSGKELQGTIAYVGMTSFAVGKWIGVVLDEPKGKNNGSIRGQVYFECPDNYGIFLRPTQLRVIGVAPDANKSTEDVTETATAAGVTPTQPTKARLSGSRTSLSSSRQSLLSSRTQLNASLMERSPSSASTASASAIGQGRRSLPPSALLSASKDSKSASNMSIPNSESGGAGVGVGGGNGNGGNGGSSHASSKRASFVETGFMEILKPQFTPSQPMRSPSFTAPPLAANASSIEDKIAAAEQQKLNEELRTQVTDLTEKLETLKQRRTEDKERLREFDKMKIQFEQLQEFRSKIMIAQSSLQKELQRAKQEAKDAIEARERHAQEMSELSDNVEMITLDKEMAEEKADTLQLELDTAKERIEELQVDLELLRSEMQNRADATIDGKIGGGGGGIGGGENISGGGIGISSYEFKQLEQQNARLKETLVRLRDLSAHDKHDIQKLTKELEMKKSEVTELERTKEKLSAKIDQLEATVVDLQDQVDAALGAEEMVEQLAEKKMELEDRVKLLEEEVAQLEALEEIHEQLVESNHELEMDLREELDMANAAKKEMLRERDAAIETIYDRDQTISKFRELVQKLNEQLMELRDRMTAAATVVNQEQQQNRSLQDPNAVKTQQQQQLSAAETIDYKQMFAESKAYTRAIDVQLRQIELTQANEHVQMLSAFMPESFMSRGGDHDSILVILLISRIVFKCGIIIGQTRERFPAVDQVTRETVIRGHAIQQYTFKCRLMHHVHNLQCALHQILYGLNSCKPDTLLRAGSSLPEMVAQEKIIDGIIELLKSNQLDENTTTENIEKCVAFFNAMNLVLLAGEDLVNETQMIRDCVSSLSSACESILNDVAITRVIVEEGGKGGGGSGASEVALLMQYLSEHTESIKQQVKLMKRRLPQDLHIIKCGIAPHNLKNMRQITQSLSRIMSALHAATKQAIQAIVAHIESDNSAEHTIGAEKFFELLATACENTYEQDDRGPSLNFKSVLGQANTDLQQMAQYLLDKEYEIISTINQQKQEKPISPIILRAQLIKKQLDQKNVLTATLENREADIKQLKLAAKAKQDELSEMQIRKDLAEKKLSVLQNEYEHTVEKWKLKYEETFELLKKKEKEFEETMDHLQNDIEALESEKDKLRDKLKSSNISLVGTGSSSVTKRGQHAANVSFSGGDTSNIGSPTSAAAAFRNISGVTAFSDMMMMDGVGAVPEEELQLLKHVCNNERTARLRLQAQQLRDKIRQFAPIHVPQPKDKRITQLEVELTKMKHAWALSLLQTGYGTAKKPNVDTIAMQRSQQPLPDKSEISNKASTLAAEILNEYLQRHPHRAANCDFAPFPTVEVKRVLKV